MRYCPIKLFGKMVGEGDLDRDESFEIVIAIVAPAPPRAGPFGVAHRCLAVRARERRIGIGGTDVVDVEGGLICGCVGVSMRGRLHPVGCSGLRRDVRLGDISGSVDFSRSLEQRIAFELPFDICGKIEVGELQQLDGLHQLRRHYEGMALPKLESLGKCHRPSGALSCSTNRQREGRLVRFLLIAFLARCIPGLGGKREARRAGAQNSGDNG
jgi:hypothetical protein